MEGKKSNTRAGICPVKMTHESQGQEELLGREAAMIRTVDMEPKCLNIVSHMFLQRFKDEAMEVLSGSAQFIQHLGRGGQEI